MAWGMGNFCGVSLEQLPAFSLLTVVGLLVAVMLIKPLNALLLGPCYAENLGVNIRRGRNFLLLATGLLPAVTTSFCGPISFIGLAVPHLARLMLGTSNHNSLMPVTLLAGGALALLCNLICVLLCVFGVFLFGRGALDMKSGVAGHMYLIQYFSEHPEELDGNLLAIGECDEVDTSKGIITALDLLEELKEKERFEYVACINDD